VIGRQAKAGEASSLDREREQPRREETEGGKGAQAGTEARLAQLTQLDCLRDAQSWVRWPSRGARKRWRPLVNPAGRGGERGWERPGEQRRARRGEGSKLERA